MEPTRIEISRADYEKQFGVEAQPDVIGICVYGNGVLLQEYIFTDEIMPFTRSEQIRQLEEMLNR